jgi:hypothetical protein
MALLINDLHMRKIILALFVLTLILNIRNCKAQTALQLSGMDCNNVSHDLFADLDAGKASVLFFFMDNCGSCPPPAQKIQTMVNNILLTYPNKVTGYAMPYNNAASCAQVSAWVSSNSLNFYSPYDSGAVQVAHYGGFGMPTVVLLGGSDHRTMFKTLAFDDTDTTIMRDSILALFTAWPSAIEEITNTYKDISIYPNPVANQVNISIDFIKNSKLRIDVLDFTGKKIATICDVENAMGTIRTQLNTEKYSNGLYLFRINVGGKIVNKKFQIIH